MGISIWLSINTGFQNVRVVDVGRYTHNCGGMWLRALDEAKKQAPICEKLPDRLCDFNGILASDAVLLLKLAVAHMDDPANRDVYVGMNPKNDWGNFESAREFLRKFFKDCRENPLCTIETSC